MNVMSTGGRRRFGNWWYRLERYFERKGDAQAWAKRYRETGDYYVRVALVMVRHLRGGVQYYGVFVRGR